ncbi:hypothetical protein A9Q84_19410 [Halobacteriovorax marinus]|uniref:3-phosphoshikimate 1-carboxyvinyltransferase n=1 Tax=Halobacteriovorax marinus TaxID=97084 RepID=A0A1Y5F8B4_9BACT|nr:hypothetical protein A9Q84_19410 [Halobacteriovorax marinus]
MNLKQSQLIVKPRDYNGTLDVPSSKSAANRILILACTVDEPVVVSNIPLSHDVENLINCLRKVGLNIEREGNSLTVTNSFPKCERKLSSPLVLETGDGGTTTRFLIPFLALGQETYIVEPEGRMKERPIEDLAVTLKNLGVAVSLGEKGWMSIQGPFGEIPKSLVVNAEKTTQHITALSLALRKSDIEPENMKYSTSYWEMTKDLINKFNGGQREFVVPVDFSSMSYPLALGAVLGSVHVKNCLEVDNFQADAILIEVLKQMNHQVSLASDGLRVKRTESPETIDFDCANCPDLVPTLAFLCSKIEGDSKLKNIDVLKYKESDRLKEIIHLLDLYKIKNSYDESADVLTITGQRAAQLESFELTPPIDHRIVMISYLFLRANGGGSLTNGHCVSKSFGNFFEVIDCDS